MYVRALVALMVMMSSAGARDLGQWENSDPEIRAWYQALRMPDAPFTPCCGQSDAYYCDHVFANEAGQFCRITDTRADGPLMRPPVPVFPFGQSEGRAPRGKR